MTNHDLQNLPQQLQLLLDNQVIQDTSGHSGAQVLKIGDDFFLKIDQKQALQGETYLTNWFYLQGLSVEVVDYISTDRDYLVTRAAKGQPAHTFLDNPKAVCQTLATTLRQLHDTSLDNVPLPNRLNTYLKTAQENAERGSFYEKALLPDFGITSREEACALMTKQAHLLTADTFIHGDYCLPNILLTNEQTVSALIDVGLAGISDRHVDLFWAVWSLHYNTGTDQYGDYFLDCYGRETVEEEKLRLIAAIEAFG
ncbi:aminoglycoside 3'-phosphotransferase [Streptococcus caprae]|uniref:Aminoglycoside 3'-phosphotransferase n=1 Tax=Streptococcus caprae TaxID=1640501 RepID=A0ABV8CTL3_9STRE